MGIQTSQRHDQKSQKARGEDKILRGAEDTEVWPTAFSLLPLRPPVETPAVGVSESEHRDRNRGRMLPGERPPMTRRQSNPCRRDPPVCTDYGRIEWRPTASAEPGLSHNFARRFRLNFPARSRVRVAPPVRPPFGISETQRLPWISATSLSPSSPSARSRSSFAGVTRGRPSSASPCAARWAFTPRTPLRATISRRR